MYKKINIHFFTGTGNSLILANGLEKELVRKGCKVEKINIEKIKIPGRTYADIELFVFPVYGFSVPHIVSSYINGFKEAKGVSAAVIASTGGGPIRALMHAESQLKKMGFDVFQTRYLNHPDNWAQFTNPMDKETAVKVISAAEKEIPKIAADLLANKRILNKVSVFNQIWSTFVGWMFLYIGRHILGMCYIADRHCNECGICVKTCPTGNIQFKKIFSKKLLWGFDCEDCNRCINSCPKKAIQVSWFGLMVHTVYEVLAVLALVKVFIHFAPGFGLVSSAELAIALHAGLFIVGIVLIIIVELTILHWILFILYQIPFVRNLSAWSWTNKFRRYMAPGFNPLKK